MRIFYFILLAILCHSCIQLRISNHAELSEAESNKAASILKVFSQFLAQNKQNENQLQAETECAQEEEEEEEEEEVVQKNIPSFIPTEYDEVKSPIFVMEHDRSFNDQEVLELEDPCKIKQGFLSYVLRYEGNVIRAQPVFAVLNTKNLALFENENVDALIKSINYKRIAEPKLLTKWDKFHCFQLTLIGEEAELKNGIIPIENTEATLCAPDLKKMISWMNAIIAFHQCMIEIVDAQQKAEEEGGEAEIGPDGSHTIIDNPTMQYFKEKQKEAEEIGKQQILEAHDHEIVEELDEQKMEQNKEKMIAEKLQELTKKLARQQQNREHDRKTNDNKRIKIQEETEKLEQQEICLERALSMKSLEEERQAEMLIEQEEQKKESKVMDDAIELLLKTGESEGHKIEHEEEYLNSAALELQDKVRQLMVAETSEFERKQNADECTSPMLAGQNECYIKEVCSKHVHDNNESDISMRTLVDCLNIRKFCFICCQRNIGIAHEKDHLICMMDCKKQLYSDPPKPKKKKKNMKKS